MPGEGAGEVKAGIGVSERRFRANLAENRVGCCPCKYMCEDPSLVIFRGHFLP